MIQMPKKTTVFGKPLDPNANANPFQSTFSMMKKNDSMQPMQPMQPQTAVNFPVQSNNQMVKSPIFGQVQSQPNSNIMLSGPKLNFNNPMSNSNTTEGNPFARIQAQSNPIFSGNTSAPKPIASPFKPQEQTMNSPGMNSFFSKPTITNPLMNSQVNNMYNKNGTIQQTTASGIFNNVQNGLSNNNVNNTSKIFGNNNNIFNQTQNQTGNIQQTPFGNNNQQNGIFGQPQQQQQNPFPFTQQQQQTNIFNQNQQTQQNQFSQNQQNMFSQQQQAPFNQQQIPLVQPNINMNDAISQYLHLYKQYLGQKHPFQQSMPSQPFNSQPNYQFNPQEQNGDYYMFLNNLVNNQSLKRTTTPRQIFEFAQGWASRMNEHKNQQNLTPEQEQSRKEISKLFDMKIDPVVYEMRMKELPPIQFTMQLLQKMNDPFSCKVIASELWLRIKERFCTIMSSVTSVIPNSGHIKLKELPYYKQILVMRKEIFNLVVKVNEMKEKDKEIKKIQYENGGIFKLVLQKYKTAFTEVNVNNKMLDDSVEELDRMLDYIDKNLKTIFKAYVQKEPISIQDPDHFMLEVSHYIAHKMNLLNKMVDDHLAIENNSEQSVDFLELAENVCNFYEDIATKLYNVRQKMKKMIQIAAQHRSYGSYQQLQAKIQEKTRAALTQKMSIYNQLKDIEDIIEGKWKAEERKQNKTLSPIRSRAVSDKTKLGLQDSKLKETIVTSN